MKFLRGLVETKQSSPKAVVARATGGAPMAAMGPYGLFGAVGSWDIEKAIKDGVEKVIWVFRATDAIATNQAQLPMVLRQGDPVDGEIQKNDRLFRLLNRRPNDYETAFQFRYRLSMQLLLSRKGAFVEMQKTNGGDIYALHLLPPHKVTPIPGIEVGKVVKEYEVTRSDWQIDRLPPENVIWLRTKPHPLDPYLQLTPLVSAGIAADTDYYSRLFNRTFIMNDGRPGLLINVKGDIDPESMEELRRRFGGGPSNAGATSVVNSEEVTLNDLTANPHDVQWLEAIRGSKEDIFLAFGTPESVMGNASGRTFDNADAERENFWHDTMRGHCDSIGMGMDMLTGNLDDDLYVGFDYDKVEVLQRFKKQRQQTALAEVLQGVRTIDGYLEETGQEPWDVVGTRILWHPSGIAIAKDPDDQAAIMTLRPVGQPAQPDLSESARQGAIQGSTEGVRKFENLLSARAARLQLVKAMQDIETKDMNTIAEQVIYPEKPGTHPYSELRARMEGKVEGVLEAWSERQEEVVLDRLMHVKARKGTRHWDGEHVGETKALNPGYVVEVDRWVNEATQAIRNAVLPMARKEARKYAQDMKDSGIVDAMFADGTGNPNAKDALEQVVGGGVIQSRHVIESAVQPIFDAVQDSARRQTAKVMDTIRELDADGASMDDIKSAVRKMIGTRSSWRKGLGVFVTTATVEGVKQAIYGHAGQYVEKTWQTVGDERVRHSHDRLDGKTKPSNRPFTTMGTKIWFPGDPTAPIGETANCRCWLEWNASEKGLTRTFRDRLVSA